jgi:hypothetical protein
MGRFEKGIAIILVLWGVLVVFGYGARGTVDSESESQR